jgi:hypothetical protein
MSDDYERDREAILQKVEEWAEEFYLSPLFEPLTAEQKRDLVQLRDFCGAGGGHMGSHIV